MQIRKLGDQGPYAVDVGYTDGKTYTFEFEKLGAEAATDLLLDILSVVGDGLGALTSLLTGNKRALDMDLGSEPIENVCRKLTSGLTRDRALTKRLLKQLSSGPRIVCNGAPIAYDSFYADKLPLSFACVRANLEVQFGNFFGAAAALLPQGQQPAAPKSPSPS